MCVCVNLYIYIYIHTHTYSQTSLIRTLICWKTHHTDSWMIKRNGHSVNVFISPDIQLLDPDSYSLQQSVKNKDNLLQFASLLKQ